MSLTSPTIQAALSAINTAGVVGVLTIAIWLGLRGDVVTAAQLHDCQTARDAYLREWIRAISPTPPIGGTETVPPWRIYLDDVYRLG